MISADDKIGELMIKLSDSAWVEDLVFALSQGTNPIRWTYMASESDKIRQKSELYTQNFDHYVVAALLPYMGVTLYKKTSEKKSYEIMIQGYEDFVKILTGWCLATRVILLHHLGHAVEPIE